MNIKRHIDNLMYDNQDRLVSATRCNNFIDNEVYVMAVLNDMAIMLNLVRDATSRVTEKL